MARKTKPTAIARPSDDELTTMIHSTFGVTETDSRAMVTRHASTIDENKMPKHAPCRVFNFAHAILTRDRGGNP